MEKAQVTETISDKKAPATSPWRDRGFPLAFVVCSGIVLTLVGFVPETILNGWRDAVMILTRIIGTMTGLVVVNNGEIMSVNGFEMRIIIHCTAIHYIALITCAILLSSWHPMRFRLTGLAVAVPLLILFNSIRLIITGLAGAISPTAFGFVHDYLWVTIFVLLTSGIWIAWDRWPNRNRLAIDRRLMMVVVLCTCFQGVLIVFDKQAGTLVAATASAIVRMIPGTPETSITWEKGRILFTMGRESFSGNFSAEMLALSVYAGLATASVITKQKTVIRTVLAGIVLMVLCSALISICAPVIVLWGKETAVLYLWVSQGVMLALPLVLWKSIATARSGVS